MISTNNQQKDKNPKKPRISHHGIVMNRQLSWIIYWLLKETMPILADYFIVVSVPIDGKNILSSMIN